MTKKDTVIFMLFPIVMFAIIFATFTPLYLSDKKSEGNLEFVLEYVSGIDNGLSDLTFNVNDSSIEYDYNGSHYKCKDVEIWGYLHDLYLKNRCS